MGGVARVTVERSSGLGTERWVGGVGRVWAKRITELGGKDCFESCFIQLCVGDRCVSVCEVRGCGVGVS